MNKIQEPSEYDSFARFYDLFFGQKDDDLAMYRDFALAADGDVLELGCGTGRLLVPLAQVGYHVTGLDVSRPMLDVAAGKIAQAGLQERVELVQGSLDDFDLQSRFSLIIIPINTFMHCYDLEQQLACLRCVRRHLLPGGQLVIDVFHPDFQSLLECDGRVVSEGTLVDPDSGHSVQWSHTRRLDRATQTQHLTFIVDEIGHDGCVRRTTIPFRMRFLYRYEMELLLRLSGYSLEIVFGSYQLEPFDSSSEKMVFVARSDWGGQ